MSSVVVAVTALNASHALFVYSRSVDGAFNSVVAVMDILAMTTLVAGCVAMIASHWFPEARRKPSWRRET